MKFRVQMCYEAWQMYHIDLDAADRDEAEAKAQALWNSNPESLEFVRDADRDDGNGATVIDCKEIDPSPETTPPYARERDESPSYRAAMRDAGRGRLLR